jgi:hypothetical protein
MPSCLSLEINTQPTLLQETYDSTDCELAEASDHFPDISGQLIKPHLIDKGTDIYKWQVAALLRYLPLFSLYSGHVGN